jgi:hypothetical protein
MAQVGLSQLYFMNFSIGNSLNLDNVNSKEKNVLFSDNSNLLIATNKNKLDFYGFYSLNIGISINYKINKSSIIELKFLNDYAYLNFNFIYANSQQNYPDFINISSYTGKFDHSIYNFSFRYNCLLNSSIKTRDYQGIKTRVFLFTSLDVLTPTYNQMINKSGSVYGIDGFGYESANNLKKIGVIYGIANINRISFRPCIGLTLKVIKKNKALFNLQTYWGFNGLQDLSQGFVKVYENNSLVLDSKYKPTTTAWYFNISKDIELKKKTKSKNK